MTSPSEINKEKVYYQFHCPEMNEQFILRTERFCVQLRCNGGLVCDR